MVAGHCMGCLHVLRFLSGEVSLQGIQTAGLSDTWLAVDSNSDKSGFTFNALDDKLVKRVNLVKIIV